MTELLALLYVCGFALTFAYCAWRSACRGELGDFLDWVVTILFSLVWPLTWISVLALHNWLNRKHG